MSTFSPFCVQWCYFWRVNQSSGILHRGWGGNSGDVFHTGEKTDSWLAYHSFLTCSLEPRKVIIIDKVSNSLAGNCFSRFKIHEDHHFKVRGASEGSDNSYTSSWSTATPTLTIKPRLGGELSLLQGFTRETRLLSSPL